MNKEEPFWLKVPDAARYFSIPRSRMYDLIHQGVIPGVRVGQRSIRVDVREVERVLKEDHQVAPK